MNSYLLLIIAGLLAPTLTSILTLPINFSKTYIETFIQPSFNFSQQQIKQYILNTTKLYLPLSSLWTISLLTITLLAETTSNNLTQTTLTVFILTIILHEVILIFKPTKVQDYLNPNKTFTPHSRTHTNILTSLLTIQSTILLLTFFAIILLI